VENGEWRMGSGEWEVGSKSCEVFCLLKNN
jgi:hypothetical protein